VLLNAGVPGAGAVVGEDSEALREKPQGFSSTRVPGAKIPEACAKVSRFLTGVPPGYADPPNAPAPVPGTPRAHDPGGRSTPILYAITIVP
jgi:hypothetical protein